MGYLDKLSPVTSPTEIKKNIKPTSGYLSKLQPVSQETQTAPQDGLLKTLAKDIVRPVATLVARPFQLAKAIGGASVEEQAIDLPFGLGRAEAPTSGSDVLKDTGRAAQTVSLGVGGAIPKVGAGVLGRTVFGRGVQQVASRLATAPGAIPVVKEAFAVRRPLTSLIKEGAGISAKGGAIFGGGKAIEEGKDLGGVIKDTAIGGATGLAGGAIPIASRAIGETVSLGRKGLGKVSSLEREALLKAGAPDARVAGEKLVGGQVVKDSVAQEAIKQGVPEADVALIKSSTSLDRSKMAKMLDIRKSQMTNRRTTARATDVVGDTFLNQAKHIAKVNKEAGKQLDVVARRLAGKKVDSTNALTAFAEDLNNAGININKKGMLDFRGSNFEGISTAQSSIQNVWSRALRVAKDGDALQHHRVKSFIDEIVDYGKKAEGLSGKVQNILKGYRRNVDKTLDTKFAQYNKVNTVFADTISELNKINQSMGRKFRLGDSFADARAGVTMRRILSNTQSRSDILQLLESMQGVAQKYGLKIDDDIVAQINFADLLERLLKSEAPTSFLGQIERGAQTVSEISGVTSALGRGEFIEGGTRAVVAGIRQARGISQENQIKSIEALLRSGGTNFGKLSPLKAVNVFGRPKALGEAVTPKTDPLAQEARKYKTAEEFVKGFSKKEFRDTDTIAKNATIGTVPFERFGNKDQSFIGVFQSTVDRSGVKKWKTRIEAGERPYVVIGYFERRGGNMVIDGHTRLTAYHDLGIKDIPVIDNTNKILKSKSQLTDIWNQENKVNAILKVGDGVKKSKVGLIERLLEGRENVKKENLDMDAYRLSYKDYVKKYEAYNLDGGGMSKGDKPAHSVINKNDLLPSEAESWSTLKSDTTEKFNKEKSFTEYQRYSSDFSPPLVESIGGGKYSVIDGHHRVVNIISNGGESVPVYFDRRTLQKKWESANNKKISRLDGNALYKELFPEIPYKKSVKSSFGRKK